MTLAASTVSPGRTSRKAKWSHRLAKKGLLSRLANVREGEIRVQDGADRYTFGQRTENSPWSVTAQILDPAFYRDVVFNGTVGSGEAYMAQRWRCDDLTTLIRILLRNRNVISGIDSGLAKITGPLRRWFHLRRKNTKHGSKKNIAEHYDLGNTFFQTFLDETLMYSCAIFEEESTSLFDGSIAKNDRICRKLQLGPGDHLLEIGTGWGGFALHAATNYKCKITTTTISEKQFAFATQRVRDAGLQDQITVLKSDYRLLTGVYDKIVSIEMLEAVGWEYFDTYFNTCAKLLKPDGMMLLQTITIQDQLYDNYRRSVDFIQRYIFPGGCLPSVEAIATSIRSASDFRIFHLEDLTPHYAQTLRHWRDRFFAKLETVRQLGFDDRFIRMWEFYLCYCEAAFEERATGVCQALLTRPRCRRPALTPTLPPVSSSG